MQIKQSIKQYPYEWLSISVLLVYFFPAIFMMDQAIYLIHDNLNSNVVWYKRLAESELMFGSGNAIVDFTMGGIPRDCLPSEWNVERLLYYFFNAQWAYTFNYILIHCIAFIGMRLLIKNYISNTPLIFNLVSLAFALLPFWPSGGITVAGLPFLVHALLNVFNDKSKGTDWLVFFLFPFYSGLTFGNAFSFSFFIFIYFVGVFSRLWKFNWKNLLPFLILTVFTILSQHRLIFLLMDGFKSNRLADQATIETFMNMKGVLGSTFLAFLFGHYHFHSFHVFIAFIVLITLAIAFIKAKVTYNIRLVLYILVAISSMAFLMILLSNYDMKSLLGEWFPKIYIRFWVLFPTLWYIVFALALSSLSKVYPKVVKPAIFIQIALVMFLLIPRDYFGSRYAENIFANTIIYKHNNEQQKWDSYYMTSEFNSMKNNIIDLVESHVVRIGISPEILQYNGLKTLEGYYAFYPIGKVYLIKEIDFKEREHSGLDVNKISHTNRNFLHYGNIEAEAPLWNFDILRAKSVKYIISDKEIEESNRLVNVYNGELLVYKIIY